MVFGPVPWDAPESVVAEMPETRSNSGSTCLYASEKPPEIMTVSFSIALPADAANNTARLIAKMAVTRFSIFYPCRNGGHEIMALPELPVFAPQTRSPGRDRRCAAG